MKIVFAPDTFKNCLPSYKVSEILKKTAERHFKKCELLEVPLADGDLGTIDTLIGVLGGKKIDATATDYLGRASKVTYGELPNGSVILETTPLLREKETDFATIQQKILYSSSLGVGELLIKCLDIGYRSFYLCAGSSTCNDGGMGCLHALGVRFYDERNQELKPAGINLQEIRRIDDSGLDPRIREAEIRVLCSVNNVLTGYDGITYVYGALNGAGPVELLSLEKGMRIFAAQLEEKYQINVADVSGSGASGGLAAGLHGVCNAKLLSGISTVLSLVDFGKILENADLVLVGEGVMDQTSVYGKGVTGISMMCKARKIPVIAIVGAQGDSAEQMYHYGISSIFSMVNSIMDENYLKEKAEYLLENVAENVFHLLNVGVQLQARKNVSQFFINGHSQEREQEKTIHWAVLPD